MPGRPPRDWFRRCEEAIEARGVAVDPGAVCGAVWARKDDRERRAITRMEEVMATKRKKKSGHGKAHAKSRADGQKKAKTSHRKSGTHRKTQRAPARHGKTARKHHRCAACGHSAQHVARQGCLHFDGKRFCSCKQRG